MLKATLLALAFVAALLAEFDDLNAAAREAQAPPAGACQSWQDCRQLALAAADRSEYQQFHDLAWRAVQIGPQKDPALMYLLARAQCLSGRPHDALVMLRRLAESGGVSTDAATNEDFRHTRELPGWPAVASIIAGIRDGGTPITAVTVATQPPPAGPGRTGRAASPASPSATATAAVNPSAPRGQALSSATASPAIAASAAKSPTLKPARVDDAARFSAGGFVAGGLAYDTVSKRFVVGDASGRKLMVVGERSDHAIDMVRADSAGFQDVMAVEIDERRGDLWVASAATTGGESVLHRLQLISGRPLRTYRPPAAAAQLVDLAVTATGSVLALDRTANQLLLLKRGETALESVLRLGRPGALSVTIAADEGIGYAAGPEGIERLDLRARTTTALTAPAGLDLGHFERIRTYRSALIAIEKPAEGTRRVVRLDLNSSGRAITGASVIDTSIPDARGATFATISGDELYYLAAEAATSGSPAAADASSSMADFIVRRVSLR